jgi:hypothetical protein
MGRLLKPVAAACLLLLTMTSCARASIEEMGRNAIRQEAAKGKDWFTRFTAATDTADRDLVAARLGDLSDNTDPYAFGWDAEGNFHTDHYYREHLTTSGGFWAEQRTVSACVRFEVDLGSVITTSIKCPDRSPFTDYTDEWVVVE